jgi:hypothetical protein
LIACFQLAFQQLKIIKLALIANYPAIQLAIIACYPAPQLAFISNFQRFRLLGFENSFHIEDTIGILRLTSDISRAHALTKQIHLHSLNHRNSQESLDQ